MNDKSQQSVANSLEVEEQLLPYMPYLLQDLWALEKVMYKPPMQLSENVYYC
ncbi:MAG: hypothetical protein KAR21_15320 [Spirochaetales bacterium]|nr:hypothetical protein [Spirochaetales bacterium]